MRISHMTLQRDFTPALGIKALTPLYDIAIATLTKEQKWRNKLIEQIEPADNDRILDVGCGTGTLAENIKRRNGKCEMHGIDPDSDVLEIAIRKMAKANLEVFFHQGFLSSERVSELGTFSKIVSSLVFHQTPLDMKLNILETIKVLLRQDGELHIADYGLQRTKYMRFMFGCTVQLMDGRSDTQPNAEGCMPKLMKEVGFTNVIESAIIPTLTGSISIYSAKRSESD